MLTSDQVEEGLQRDIATLRRALELDGKLFQALPQTRPFLVILSGLPGTGKSYFARELARHLPFLVLESDRLRKALVAAPKYTPGESSRLFAACHRLTEEYLAEGQRVLFDATNLMEAHRQPLYHLADRMGVPLLVVRLTAPGGIVRRRLSARVSRLHPEDHSDADWLVYCRMLPTEEPISRKHLIVDSSLDIATALEQIVRLVNTTALRL